MKNANNVSRLKSMRSACLPIGIGVLPLRKVKYCESVSRWICAAPKALFSTESQTPSSKIRRRSGRCLFLRRALPGAGLLIALTVAASAQSDIACGNAIFQLQSYVQQVNTIAQVEYSQGIPARCGFNGYCTQFLLQQLSVWYGQQSLLVNHWYGAIQAQCTSQPSAARRKQKDPTEEIASVDDLQVDDEDKTVRIKIPSTPSGFRGKE